MTEPYDEIMSCLDPAMVIATAGTPTEQSGCLIGFHAQGGIDPLRYCLWLSKANRTYALMQRSTFIGIHFPAHDDDEIAAIFGGMTGDEVDKFELTPTESGEHDVPLLSHLPNRIIARKVAVLDDGSDHVCVTTEPVSVSFDAPFTPLRLSRAEQLRAGHSSDEPTHL